MTTRGAGLNGTALLKSWEQAQTRGLTQAEHAAEIGIPMSAYASRMYRAKAEAGNPASQTPDDVPMPTGEIDKDEIIIEPKENGELSVSSFGRRITSIPQLLEACRADMDFYNLGPGKLRKWDVVLKQLDGTPNIVEAIYVATDLIPKIIEASRFVVQPVQIKARLPQGPRQPPPAQGRGLILTDTQVGFRRDIMSGALDPFHDRAAMDVALQIAQYERFDHVTWLGDLLDCTEMSDKFVREPGFYFTTQPAIYESHWWLAQFVKAQPKAQQDVIEGNHDKRLPLALINHALGMHNLQKATETVEMPSMSVPSLLSMPELGIEYIDGYPNNETWQGPVRIIHGDIARNAPGSTAAALVAGAQESTVQGHIHRIEQASKTINIRGKIRHIQGVSPGCLCRVDYVVPGHKRGQQWQQGIAVVEWDGDYSNITTIPIRDGVAIYRGRKFIARDRVADLNADTEAVRRGWKF